MNKVEQLKKCLQKARKELNDKGYKYIPGESRLMDCKPFEVAYQDCIEKIWPEEPWWKVTNYWDIFDAMMGGLSDEEVIDEICKHVDSEFLKEGAEKAKVEEHSYEEYMKKFGVAYKEGELWDFSEEDFKDGAVEINPEMTYWKIEVDGEPRYFETLDECKESKLNEGTSNFGRSDFFPLLVFYTLDEVYDMMLYSSERPEEEDFEDEDGNIDYDAFEEARDAFEQKFFDDLDCCVLDEDEQERLEDRIFDFNSETQSIADRRWHDDVSDDEYSDLSNLEDVKVDTEAGYYEANYIVVENENSLKYMSEAFKEEQIKRISDFLKSLKEEFGLSEYEVAWGPASNGETGYRKVKDESLKEVEENMYDGKKGGNKGSVKTKVHVNKNAGNPKRNMEIFNHMMGTGPEVSTGVSLGESEDGIARVEYCLMKDGDNVDCYATEEEAIKNARELAKELSDRGLDNKGVRVLLVKYGPKNAQGDEPELGCENIWAVHFDEPVKEGKELKEYNLPKDAKPYKTCGDKEYYIATFDDTDRAMMGNKSTHTVVTKKIGGDFDMGSASGLDFDSEEKAKQWIDDACKNKKESLKEMYDDFVIEDKFIEYMKSKGVKNPKVFDKDGFFIDGVYEKYAQGVADTYLDGNIDWLDGLCNEERCFRDDDDNFDNSSEPYYCISLDNGNYYEEDGDVKFFDSKLEAEEFRIKNKLWNSHVTWDDTATNESLNEEKEELYDKVAKVLDDYGILYGDLVDNGDGTVNIVGVDEEEWDEVVEAIKAELGLDVLVPDEDHGEFDDELIVTESHHKSKKYKIIYEDDFITNDDGSIRLFSKEEAREFLDSVDINDRNNYDVVEESLKGEKLVEEKSESSLVKKIKESIKAFLESNGWESDDIELFVIEEEPFVDGEGNKANHIQIRNDLIGFYRAVDLGLIDNLDEIVDPGYFEPYSRFVWDAYIWEGEGE